MIALKILLAAALASAAPAADDRDARVTDAKGDVLWFSSGAAEGLPAETDVPLEEGDRLKVGPASSVEISVDGVSILYLRENTDFEYKSSKRSATIFELSAGGVLAKIRKLAASEAVQVRTPQAVTSVRGTEFGVEITPEGEGETHVGVFDEGKVEVRGQSGAPEVVNSNQETKIARGQAPMHPYFLQRFSRHRSFMRQTMRRRASALAARWSQLSPEQRLELRQRSLGRMKLRREKLRDKLDKRHDKRDERRDQNRKRNQERMDKRREDIRRRGANP